MLVIALVFMLLATPAVATDDAGLIAEMELALKEMELALKVDAISKQSFATAVTRVNRALRGTSLGKRNRVLQDKLWAFIDEHGGAACIGKNRTFEITSEGQIINICPRRHTLPAVVFDQALAWAREARDIAGKLHQLKPRFLRRVYEAEMRRRLRDLAPSKKRLDELYRKHSV